MHFDLTVPFARYVLENAGKLEFPFRRFQIQPAWRGERPQEGRYRQFTQADIDIVGRDTLGFHHDVEVVRVMVEALGALPLPPLSFQVNNRKLIQGFYRGLGIADVTTAIRVIDKLDKLPAETVAAAARRAGRRHARAGRAVPAARHDPRRRHLVRRAGARPRRRGRAPRHRPRRARRRHRRVRRARPPSGSRVEANLRIARGLDYYTGTVLEVFMAGYERLKSVGGGGRYDALASDGKTTYPGVGVSFGVSRTLIPLIADGVLAGSRKVPSAVLVAVTDEADRDASTAVATALRARGVACEVSADAAKFGKQIRAAERRGIPFVWFTQADGSHQVKDIRSGDQVEADPATWTPPEADLRPQVVSTHHEHRGEPVIRTHDAGALRAEHVGQTVVLAGWVARRRDHGGVAFLDLREASGVVQVVVRDEEVAHSLRSEFCLKVTGEVVARKPGNENPNLPTGDIEVVADRRRGALPPARRCRSRSTTPAPPRAATWGRRPASSTATSTCAAAVPTTPCACAARSTRPPATSSTATTSSRSRPRR